MDLQAFITDLKSNISKLAPPAQQQGKAAASAAANANNYYSSNFSCKISPWLAMGCLSPRQMYHDMQKNLGSLITPTASPAKAPAAGSSSASAQPTPGSWLVFELLWRDFFRFITRKYSAMGLNGAAGAQPAQHAAAAAAATPVAMPALVAA